MINTYSDYGYKRLYRKVTVLRIYLVVLLLLFSASLSLLVASKSIQQVLGMNTKQDPTVLGASTTKTPDISLADKDPNWQVQADIDNNIFFYRRVANTLTIVVKVLPKTEGQYLFYGPECSAWKLENGNLKEIAPIIGVVAVNRIDNENSYYVQCIDQGNTFLYNFRLLYIVPSSSAGLGIGWDIPIQPPLVVPNLQGTRPLLAPLGQTIQVTPKPTSVPTQQPTSQSSNQPNTYTFSPANNFTPQNNYYAPTAAPTSTPAPTSQTNTVLNVPLPSVGISL